MVKDRENNIKEIVGTSAKRVSFPGILRTLMMVNGHATATMNYHIDQKKHDVAVSVVDTDDMPLYSFNARYFDEQELKGRKIKYIYVISDTVTTPLFLEWTTIADSKEHDDSGRPQSNNPEKPNDVRGKRSGVSIRKAGAPV